MKEEGSEGGYESNESASMEDSSSSMAPRTRAKDKKATAATPTQRKKKAAAPAPPARRSRRRIASDESEEEEEMDADDEEEEGGEEDKDEDEEEQEEEEDEEDEDEEDEEEDEEEQEEEDTMEIGDGAEEAEAKEMEGGVFAHYRPKKLKIGLPHPGNIVETSVLSRADPPDVWYELHPGMARIIKRGLLSSAQLESIVYASQQHERAVVNGNEVGGFFVGDGGKREGGMVWRKGRREGCVG